MKKDELKKEKQVKHPYDCLKIKDTQTCDNNYSIQVYLDCSCGENKDQPIVSFVDNDLLPAQKLFFAWFSEVAPWFIQQGYKIVDTRQGKECSDEN